MTEKLVTFAKFIMFLNFLGLRIYPEEYREVVYSFLTLCLSQERIVSQPLLTAAAAAITPEADTKTKSD